MLANWSHELKKVVIFGNSGSGKSTLARELADSRGLTHLDLDTLAWKASMPPERMAIEDSKIGIDAFINQNAGWVIEGCYSDLLELVVPIANEIIFLDLPVEDCVINAKNRPWEPHKYESKEAQDSNLNMLIEWISRYDDRDDTFSRAAHETIYRNYPGQKTRYRSNQR